MDFNCGLNKSEISLISLAKYATETLNMLAEMILESTIPDKELEIHLTNKRQEHLVNIEKTAYLARKKFSALLFGETHPYANQIQESDFNRITPELVRNFYHRHIHARNCRIIICGNVNEDILKATSKLFNQLPSPSQTDLLTEKEFHPATPGRYHVPKENSVQSSLRIGKTGIRLTHEDYAGFMLLNTIL